jgi:RNA polymerase sigma-70 factor (ECF subfamily)
MPVDGIRRPLLAPIEPIAASRLTVDTEADAFRRLVSARLDAAYRLATVVLGDPVEAEDATHDAVVRAWSSFGTLRDPTRFDAWFQRIVVNSCRDRMRRRRVRRSVPLESALPGLPALADATQATPERDALARALERLTPDHRMVVVLRYYADLPIEAIAQRLGEPSGTIRSRLHHALRSLRAAYDAGARLPDGDH